jgi:DNA polymerase-3 subunit delta'
VPLSAIIGHHQVVDLLQRAAARGTVPQSLLFAGPNGVGKHAVAVALAQAVNCPKAGPDKKTGAFDACGVCQTCQRIARGQHFDVVDLGLEGAATIKIDDLRDRVLDVVGYRPFEARRRVFIIDPAEALTAQDALLKTLEEPPASAMLILITAKPDMLAPTVQSRCRRLRFGALTDAEVAGVLSARCEIEPARARVLASMAGGSVARALSEEAGQVAEDRDAALALLSAVAGDRTMTKLKAAVAFTQHDSDRRDREALSMRLVMLSSFLRDLAAIGAGEEGRVSNTDMAADLARLSGTFDRGRVLDAWAAIERAQAALSRNAGPKIVADWVALTI